jgi:hypothetical protein
MNVDVDVDVGYVPPNRGILVSERMAATRDRCYGAYITAAYPSQASCSSLLSKVPLL